MHCIVLITFKNRCSSPFSYCLLLYIVHSLPKNIFIAILVIGYMIKNLISIIKKFQIHKREIFLKIFDQIPSKTLNIALKEGQFLKVIQKFTSIKKQLISCKLAWTRTYTVGKKVNFEEFAVFAASKRAKT